MALDFTAAWNRWPLHKIQKANSGVSYIWWMHTTMFYDCSCLVYHQRSEVDTSNQWSPTTNIPNTALTVTQNSELLCCRLAINDHLQCLDTESKHTSQSAVTELLGRYNHTPWLFVYRERLQACIIYTGAFFCFWLMSNFLHAATST